MGVRSAWSMHAELPQSCRECLVHEACMILMLSCWGILWPRSMPQRPGGVVISHALHHHGVQGLDNTCTWIAGAGGVTSLKNAACR